MTVYERLLTETAAARAEFLAIPLLRRALAGNVPRPLYIEFLQQAYHHVRHTCPLLSLAAAATEDGLYRDVLRAYMAEEEGHEQWILSAAARQGIRERIEREWGALDVLVNNAGIVAACPVSDVEDADLERLVATNLVAPLALVRDLLPLLLRSEAARIVNVGSLAGDIALPFFAAYSASKFGLRGLSAALRRELGGLGVDVTYVAPRGAYTAAAQAVARYLAPLGAPLDLPEAIARQVWDGVARRADSVYPRGQERLLVLLDRLWPALVTRALAARFASAGSASNGAAATRSAPISEDAAGRL